MEPPKHRWFDDSFTFGERPRFDSITPGEMISGDHGWSVTHMRSQPEFKQAVEEHIQLCVKPLYKDLVNLVFEYCPIQRCYNDKWYVNCQNCVVHMYHSALRVLTSAYNNQPAIKPSRRKNQKPEKKKKKKTYVEQKQQHHALKKGRVRNVTKRDLANLVARTVMYLPS